MSHNVPEAAGSGTILAALSVLFVNIPDDYNRQSSFVIAPGTPRQDLFVILTPALVSQHVDVFRTRK